MPRVKRGKTSLKKRKALLKRTRGYRHGRSKKEKLAREALLHAGSHALTHRRAKKRDMRKLWNIKINAAARVSGVSYSKLINLLKKEEILINRKILAEIAEKNPAVFEKIVEKVK